MHMPDTYEKLLEEAYSHITERSDSGERFNIPAVKVYFEGKTTVLENFTEIYQTLRREPDHLMKHMLSELGTAGKIEGSRAVFNGKFEQDQIESIIRGYVDDYVICSECGKPDTRLVKEGRINTLRCDACGGHRPVRKRKARSEVETERISEGMEIDVLIDHISKRGDGVAKIGRYTIYVANSKTGQTVKVRITRIAGSIAFTEKLN
jgi:translation initiation factor 2 subunit 2